MANQYLTLSQRFSFDAAHSLAREIETESSQGLHGQTYHAEVSVHGPIDPRTGMVADVALLRAQIEVVRKQLDDRLLDEVAGLGIPTLENLCLFIAQALSSLRPSQIRVWREAAGDECCLRFDTRP
ncbi:6-carboxytetrahydropterin synthase [Variovorax saccharolyticus]|uniref:6-carboxytetrahydropterin synthase n=1 Tax=Variovorax saccharolyticus TaxID=3053516 RepID=UPI002577FAB6|nr:6-carboxytetrahydropterin synthase [Variovorax sp. J31P216]MDM0029883.1 6-carboxytetrahydropterin synthase [Variovorax sp. J31P216]